MSVYDSIPITKSTINNYERCQEYTQKKNPLTHIVEVVLPPFTLEPFKANKDLCYYGVRIVTGSQETSSHDNTISLELIGEGGRTGKIAIGSFFNWTKSSEDTFDDYIVECQRDLGEIQLVTISNDEVRKFQSNSNWFVDFTYVVNLKTGFEQNFPCYHWLGDGEKHTSPALTGILKSVKRNRIVAEQRSKQVAERKEEYVWQFSRDIGYPSFMSTKTKPPLDEKFERVKNQDVSGDLIAGKLTILKGSLLVKMRQFLGSLFGAKAVEKDSLQTLHNFYTIAHGLVDNSETAVQEMLTAYETFRFSSDVHFGQQMLNGVNCVVVNKCEEIPKYFDVNNQLVQPFLNRGQTLDQAIKDDHIYICDLSQIMDKLPCKEEMFCAAPICLLYVNGSNQLVPIAIQLNRNKGPDNPVFVPSDGRVDWMLAKMFYASASAQHHQMSTHFISCHSAMEAYCMATMRNLPDAHPVYKLVRPHFRYTLAINLAARSNLINNGGTIDQLFSIGGDDNSSGKSELVRRTNAIYDVHWTHIREDLKRRGISPDDREKLPNYFYRDDGVRLWDAIEEFARSILTIFYKSDKEVEEDDELKSWVQDIYQNGFPEFNGGKQGRGFPEKIVTINKLAEYCTLIMFTGSVQHSAVNFGQFQTYGYVPNSPSNMRNPPPTKKGVTSEIDMLNTLPTIPSTGLAVAVTWALSQMSPDEIFLGGYPTMWYSEHEPKLCIAKFLDQLKAINEDIKERNKKLDVPYEYLISSRCPNSITI